jgi:hypothetical protein
MTFGQENIPLGFDSIILRGRDISSTCLSAYALVINQALRARFDMRCLSARGVRT